MDGAAASTGKSICGWTWHSALNIIPPWSTLFLHVYLVTAVTDWEGRVYPAAVGIALLTHDFQLHSARATRNVCHQFIMRKKLKWSVRDPGLGFLVFQSYKCLVENSKAPLLGIVSCVRLLVWGDSIRLSLMQRLSPGGRVMDRAALCWGVMGGRAVPQGSWAGGCKLEVHNVF